MFVYVNMLNGVSYLIRCLRMFRFDPPINISKPRLFYIFRRIIREHWKEMGQTISLAEIKFSQEMGQTISLAEIKFSQEYQKS